METQQTASPDFSSITRESASEFDIALHHAVRNSVVSMNELRSCVEKCVAAMKRSNMGPVQVILTMKALVKESNKRYRPLGDEEPKSSADVIIDYVVKWAIIEYYQNCA